jgi:hypothetical protein
MINGCEVEITANLDSALRQFRQESHGPFWIDALCINQNDTSEKGKQVLRMKDIFSRATEVIAWLGPAGQNSDKAITLMKSFGKHSPAMHMQPGGEPVSPEISRTDDVKSWEALGRLLGRPYWKRTWILQELALAEKIIFRCGDETAIFGDLRGIDTIIARYARSLNAARLPLREAHLSSIMVILGLRDLDERKEVLSCLTSVLWRSREQQVTDLRDKVYGLLSIALDGTQLIPDSTYDISAAELYIRLTKSLIMQSECLDYIRYKCPFGASELDLPTWTLDLSTPCFNAATTRSKTMLQVPSSWKNPGIKANPLFVETGSHCLLGTWGINLGIIDGLGSIYAKDTHSHPHYGVIQPDSDVSIYASETLAVHAIAEALLDRVIPWENTDIAESDKAGIKALWQPQYQHLYASMPTFSVWLNENRNLSFGGRTIADWTFLAPDHLNLERYQKPTEQNILGRKAKTDVVLLEPKETDENNDDASEVPSGLQRISLAIRGSNNTTRSTNHSTQDMAEMNEDSAEIETSTAEEGQDRAEDNGSEAGAEIATGSSRSTEAPTEQVRLSRLGFQSSSTAVFEDISRMVKEGITSGALCFSPPPSSSSPPFSSDKMAKIQEIFNHMSMVVIGSHRRLFTTKNGYIGTAHPQAQKGDKIFMMQGASAPFVILRDETWPAPASRSSNDTQRSGHNGAQEEREEEGGNTNTNAVRTGPKNLYRVIGEATLGGITQLESTRRNLNWEEVWLA